MSNLDDTRARIERFSPTAYGDATVQAERAKATALQALALVAQAEEQRITSLVILLDKVSVQVRQTVMDELASRLGIRELF